MDQLDRLLIPRNSCPYLGVKKEDSGHSTVIIKGYYHSSRVSAVHGVDVRHFCCNGVTRRSGEIIKPLIDIEVIQEHCTNRFRECDIFKRKSETK